MLGVFALAFLIYRDARNNKSFYFILLVVLYSYIAVSSLVVRLFTFGNNDGAIALLFMYFIASAIGLIFLLINLNKKFNV